MKSNLIISCYDNLSRWEKFHLKTRLKSCPYDKILKYLPKQGNMLDVGCGYGHFAWFLLNKGYKIKYTGTDIDPQKIKVAVSSSTKNIFGIDKKFIPQFFLGTPQSLKLAGPYEIITIIDVLYLLLWNKQKELLRWCFNNLCKKKEAVILIKNPNPESGILLFKSLIQEWIMVNIIKKTCSSGTILGAQHINKYKEYGSLFGMNLKVEKISRTGLLLIYNHI